MQPPKVPSLETTKGFVWHASLQPYDWQEERQWSNMFGNSSKQASRGTRWACDAPPHVTDRAPYCSKQTKRIHPIVKSTGSWVLSRELLHLCRLWTFLKTLSFATSRVCIILDVHCYKLASIDSAINIIIVIKACVFGVFSNSPSLRSPSS